MKFLYGKRRSSRLPKLNLLAIKQRKEKINGNQSFWRKFFFLEEAILSTGSCSFQQNLFFLVEVLPFNRSRSFQLKTERLLSNLKFQKVSVLCLGIFLFFYCKIFLGGIYKKLPERIYKLNIAPLIQLSSCDAQKYFFIEVKDTLKAFKDFRNKQQKCMK